MRRFDAVWGYSGSAYTDYTATAGRGGAACSLQGSDKLYIGHEDWLSGALILLTTPASDVTYVVEQWDGEEWKELPTLESYENLQVGYDILEQAFDWTGNGVLEWGRSPFRWFERAGASNSWPENTGTVPDTTARFWVRIRLTSGGPVVVDRVLPLLYNTYATYSDLASFMGLPEFDELNQPTASEIRKQIRRQEDLLDQHTRRAWRPRYVRNETHNFNPYGIKLHRGPVQFLTDIGLWNGTTFETMTVGRGEDAYLDRTMSMIYPLTPSFRLRYYSFLLSRYMRQPQSFRASYVYGEDFDMVDSAHVAQGIVLRRTAADLVISGDWSRFLTSGLDVLPKPEKVRSWLELADEQADTLRKLYTA